MKRGIKVLIALFLVVSAAGFCYAAQTPQEHFTSIVSSVVLPIDSEVGQTVDSSSDAEHKILSEALKTPFGIEWTDKYFDESSKASLASVNSPLFARLLPSSNFFMSRSYKNGDSSISITVRFETGDIVTFTLLDSKIIAVK